MVDLNFDLFGLPVIERHHGRGRPEHVRTVENARKAALLFACGHEVADVAAALGISQPTLRKHYFSEVEGRRHASIRMRAKQLDRLNTLAESGNVAAEKALAGLIQSEQVRTLASRMAKTQHRDDKKPAAPKLGKKEQAQANAHGVSGKFAPPPQPSLLN